MNSTTLMCSLHVVDVSHPNLHERMPIVDDTLRRVGLDRKLIERPA